MKSENLIYYYDKFKYGDHCYHNLMKRKIENILLISSFYDAFIFERDGRLSHQLFGEYRSLNLSMAPKITSVPTGNEALKRMENEKFDMIITMPRIGTISPFELVCTIKDEDPQMPVVLLLSMLSDTKLLPNKKETRLFDDIFLWNGDSKLFLAMIKSVEDKMNIDNDTKVGLTRVVLLVEDSIKYYSMFLPLLYQEIMKQTQFLLESEVAEDDRRIRMRARPKIMLAHNLKDALKIYHDYKEYIISVITDTAYPGEDDKTDEEAGIKLLKTVKNGEYDIPSILLSSDERNRVKAEEIKSLFIYKYSSRLLKRVRDFIISQMGFGEFVFRSPEQNVIASARTLGELKKRLYEVPLESIRYHSQSNHFSAWLMARGEIEMARKLRALSYRDFESIEELRDFLFDAIVDIQKHHGRGKIIDFYDYINLSPNEVTRLRAGSLGGKGRGLAFINSLMVAMELDEQYPEMNIYLPNTAIIGTNEYDELIENNQIMEEELNKKTDEEIDRFFLSVTLSEKLRRRLRILLENVKYPIAVRSSGLLEDSYAEPFAGIYRTFMLPNNHPDPQIRLSQVMDAIKLVYASVFNSKTREYIENMNHQLDEEKMAVIIQQIVGKSYDDRYFYPHFSGVAQSYNFYPISKMKHQDGIVSLAMGMGKTVVEGGKVFRFCPKHPKKQFLVPEAQLKNTQKEFYAIDLHKNDENLLQGDQATLDKINVSVARKHGSLNYIASTWDLQNQRIVPGVEESGPVIVNFDNIIKYHYLPFANIMKDILEVAKTALGMPAEIEFAVDLTTDEETRKPTFYILQIRPLTIKYQNIDVPDSCSRTEHFIYTDNSMGNGKIDNLTDIVYIKPGKFDKTRTEVMRDEIRNINRFMKDAGRRYLLIGPGRWGSQDRFIGIPVGFVDISNAKVIIEAGLDHFEVDPSQGTHFFHNVVAMELGYLFVPNGDKTCFIDWEWLFQQEPIMETFYFRHVGLKRPLIIKIDGKRGKAVVYKNE